MSGTGVGHPVPYSLIIFDADGTLRRCTVAGQPCPNAHGEWELMPKVGEVLACYDWEHRHLWGIVSNQGGVGLGYVDGLVARTMLEDTAHRAGLPLWRDGGKYSQVFMCPHTPSEACICRKPSPYGIFKIASGMYITHRPNVCLVGDRPEDEEAAGRAGVAYYAAEAFFGWQDAPPAL